MLVGLSIRLPRDAMPSHSDNLMLDEQSFQGLLAAAFTIQEHNDRRARQTPILELAPPSAAPSTSCPHCGAAKSADESRCPSCGRDQFRPGERMQRNWASMWLMSQDQGLWPERTSGSDNANPQEMTGGTHPPTTKSASQAQTIQGSVNDGALTLPKVFAGGSEATNGLETSVTTRGQLRVKAADTRSLPKSPIKSPVDDRIGDNTRADRAQTFTVGHDHDNDQRFDLHGSDVILPVPSYALSASEDFSPAADATAEGLSGVPAVPLMKRISDWRVILRFHRADLYLGLAIVIAVIALLWPSAAAPHRPTLGLVQRAMVGLGIAEVPTPATVRLQGDPGVEVWVDPHTALYYCPGEERYGKIADGHFTSQRDAQMDRFEPASRSACE
jgi:glutaredoxin